MRKSDIGDLYEVETREGMRYIQLVNKHKLMGPLIRVIAGTWRDRPGDILAVAKSETEYYCFFPVGSALKQQLISKVGSTAVRETDAAFPIFRTGMPSPGSSKIKRWSLWDGEKSWVVGALSDEQRHLSIRGIWNFTLLKERLETGWSPYSDVR